jgi:Septum formation
LHRPAANSLGALVQTRREGGKGWWMAIVGIVLGALWTVFLTIGIIADAQDNEPTPPGAVKRDVTTLKAGDCTAHIPDGRVPDVPVIDCAKPHREEVYAVLTLSGSKYPGETEVDDQANDMCNEQARLDAQGRRRVPDRRLSRETGGK